MKHFLHIFKLHKWQFIEHLSHDEVSQIPHLIKFSLFFEEMQFSQIFLLQKEQ